MAWEFKCIIADNFFRFSRSIITSRKKTLSLLFMLYLLNSQRCSSIRFSAWSTSVLLESNFLFLWRWKLQRFARTIWPFVSQFPVSLTSFPTNGYSLSISKQKTHWVKIHPKSLISKYFVYLLDLNLWLQFSRILARKFKY